MKNDRISPNPHPVKPPLNMPEPRKESLKAENARLKAEVERLTKLCQATSPDGFIHIRDINAAKEGKPSV